MTPLRTRESVTMHVARPVMTFASRVGALVFWIDEVVYRELRAVNEPHAIADIVSLIDGIQRR
jgi:hypothetical protein